MRNYTCAKYVNTANLRRILRARKVDRDQLAQLKSLEKRLRTQGSDHHRLDFAKITIINDATISVTPHQT